MLSIIKILFLVRITVTYDTRTQSWVKNCMHCFEMLALPVTCTHHHPVCQHRCCSALCELFLLTSSLAVQHVALAFAHLSFRPGWTLRWFLSVAKPQSQY